MEEQTLGWAELECALAYNEFSAKNLDKMVQIFINHGFKFYEKLKFSASTMEYDDLELPNNATYEDFIQKLTHVKYNTAVINLYGMLYDLQAKVSLCFFSPDKVVTISSRENFIWGHGNNLKLSDINRVKAFFALCKEICKLLPPRYACISSEEAHPDTINVESAEENGFTPYDEKMFSDESAQEMLDWYLKTYV